MDEKNKKDEYQWIIGPKLAAVKRKKSRIWSVVEPPEGQDEIRLGLAMALSRSDTELDEDPASCSSVVQYPVPLSSSTTWFIGLAWLLIFISSALTIWGLIQNHTDHIKTPAALITNWGNFSILLGATFAGYLFSVYIQALVLLSFCRNRKHIFGVGGFLVKVEPVIWRLGVPYKAAFFALAIPLFMGTASWAWQPASREILTGLAIGCWIYVMMALFPLRPGVGTRLMEWILKSEDLPQRLRWALTSRFLPFGQTIETGTGASLAWAAVSLAVWIIIFGVIIKMLSARPALGLSLPGVIWCSLVSIAGFCFTIWLIFLTLHLGQMAYLLRGRKRLSPITPKKQDIKTFERNLPLFKHFPELSQLDWQWYLAPAGTLLIRYGERERIFFWIATGEARVLGRTPSGDIINLAAVHGNTGVGEIAFLDERPRTADILITKSALVASLTYEQFSSVVKGESHERFRDLVLVGQAFEQSNVFHKIPDEDKENWITKGAPRRYKAGDVIIEAGVMERWMGLIVVGEVEVVQDNTTVAILNIGDVFGEIAFLDDRPRTATLYAIKNVLLWRWEPEWLNLEIDRVKLKPLLTQIAKKRKNP